VRGALEVLRTEQGLSVVNEVPLEDYVAGVLQGEVPAGWSPAVLRAQAVVSRTYALHERGVHGARGYHLEASTMSQVYAGADVSPSIRSAVESTRCEVLVYDGAPILAAFHSASGGRTASAREVWGRDLRYLVSQDVADEDDSPDTYWRALVSRTTLGRALGAAGHEIGEPKAIEVTKRSPSGRVAAMRIRGSRGKATLSGRQLRSLLGEAILKSTLFELRPHPSGFRFVGSGHGHGVGMSQWGARSLAENGADYLEILRTFYPGAELQRGRTSRVDRDTWPEERRSRGSRMREERKVATRSGGEE
jgi:stage II sporulation protein D